MDLEDSEKGEQQTFRVSCIGYCRDTNVHLAVQSGDADLYAREGEPPKIENSNCNDCPMCKSRSSNLEDACSGLATMEGDIFFVAVVAHKPFRGGTLTVTGYNLKNVTVFSTE